ncbi:MAG: dihydrofolate reductase family protein [Candidatus Sulfotelmatobacter sp.]
MRKVIVSNLASVDGFFEGSNKELDWHVVDDEFFAYAKDMLRNADTLFFGAVTYQLMAAYWPTAPSDEIAERMNNLPKVVFSRTLKSLDWNNSRLVSHNIPEEVSKLKQQAGKDIVVLGSAELASSLLQWGLVDEYRVIVNPVLLGKGRPLFTDITERIRLKLLATKVLASGVVMLSYQRA